MDGIHDLGGMHGFGAVQREDDEPPFHDAWEGRVHGMMLALAVGGTSLPGFRHAIERMDPAEYLSTTYYEHWLTAVETLLLESGRITRAELAGARGRAVPNRRVPAEAEVVRTLFRPFLGRDTPAAAPRFSVGDVVRVRRVSTPGHTRCPRYVRGVRGVVERENGPSPLPDERRVEAYYTVAFDSVDVWGPDAEPFTFSVDLYESYLEPA